MKMHAAETPDRFAERILPMAPLQSQIERMLARAGVSDEMLHDVAEVLLIGEAIGHATHGLALLPTYLDQVLSGDMAVSGQPSVLSDRGPAVLWDGRRLPGPWLVRNGLAVVAERARRFGTCTLVIAESHHVAALASYLVDGEEQDMLFSMHVSAPHSASVAPAGGIDGVLSPNPVAAGFGSGQSRIVLDVSTSSLSNHAVARMAERGMPLPPESAMTRSGEYARSAGEVHALLPFGGSAGEHKAFAFALLNEVLTNALSGHGRTCATRPLLANVCLQAWDPAAFAGRAELHREIDGLYGRCTGSRPRDPHAPVRLPGQLARARLERARSEGVRVAGELLDRLQRWCSEHRLAWPDMSGAAA